ncbi:MAG: hypothetical protein DCC43_01720 [Candidatus Brocadia sp.]|jgi:hypothetical protein|nr:hypothetical protein [Candidatus Brocadia fulgida]MCE7910400.1 hypothetical protein [Candidatus Brocadia sp. AMX3]OQZ02608.1 MAG: hypothetical protein B6D35_00805 [Candidatus Brocadia sp. UTAMX2]RIK02929.1 MAG: hypothetical protein DCC43_01720 [Candidatus Brocadia sp.]
MVMEAFQNNIYTKSWNIIRSEGKGMRKIVPMISLCLFLLSVLGCKSFTKKNNTMDTRNSPAEETVSHPKGSGYLSNGPTVVINAGEEGQKTSFLEQFDQLRKDLASSLGKNASIVKELESEKAIKLSLESELEEFGRQAEVTQQLIIENEKVCKKLEESQAPYEKKIRELTFELTKAQIEATKAKQELIRLKIEHLVERDKQKSDISQQ